MERREQKIENELLKIQNIHKYVFICIVPFAIANGVFILPFKFNDQYVNFVATGLCHSIMLIAYILFQIAFVFIEFKVWDKLKQTNFIENRVNKWKLGIYFLLVNLYLTVHIWMMTLFSQGFIKSMFTNSITEENLYSQFFHSNMNLEEMQNMNTEFKIIMVLLHFNPINLMLKFSIIKFESFTTIIIETKS